MRDGPLRCIGLMSGTSVDAIDLALAEPGPQCLRLIEYRQQPFPDALRQAVRALAADTRLAELMRLDHLLGCAFADAVIDFLGAVGLRGEDIQAIGSHGQTVAHRPDAPACNSWQLGDANIIAWRTRIPVVADFRRMDMAAGGQGAPLAPAFHARQFGASQCARVIVNIGGIANITLLPSAASAAPRGFDTGPGNGLLDDWNLLHNGTRMDENGAWAGAGRVDRGLLDELLRDPWFRRPPPKSTGREYFNLDWLKAKLGARARPAEDVQASLLELTARSVGDAILSHGAGGEEVYVCGGGARNPLLMRRLAELLPGRAVATTTALGIDPDAVEAAAFAWFAWCRVRNIPVALRRITGGSDLGLLGAVYAVPAAT